MKRFSSLLSIANCDVKSEESSSVLVSNVVIGLRIDDVEKRTLTHL